MTQSLEKTSDQIELDQVQLEETHSVLEKHSQAISNLQAASALLQQRLDDQNLKAELRYNEITGWYSQLQQVREKLNELLSLKAGQPENSMQASQSDTLQLKKLQEEYQKLQVWSQELDTRLHQIQSHWLYRILGRFIR